jgi:energy-coupling factor transport system permease protein
MSARASVLLYRRLASPLHAARAGVGALWCAALALAALAVESPLALLPLLGAVLSAGALAGVGRALVRSLRVAAVLAVPIVVVNVLVSREGLTVFARLGDLGPFGRGNLTVEAAVYGATIALKVAILMLATTLASLAVDPDELLRVARRLSFRSALTASLATRMLAVLAADARRLADAQSTLAPAPAPLEGLGVAPRRRRRRAAPGGAAARARLVSAVVASSLDRALDVAATLELRGFAHGGRRRSALDFASGGSGGVADRTGRRPWSRHDLGFAVSAGALALLTLAARLGDFASFQAYPEVHTGPPGAALALVGALVLLALLPFADRRGIEP